MKPTELAKKLSKGKDYVVTMANAEDSPCIVDNWITTDCLALDHILGGGIPIGRVVEIYGDTSTGKTLIAGQTVAAAQQAGYLCLYIDAERAVSLDVMEAIGVNTSEVIYADPVTIEEVWDLMEEAVTSKGDVPMIIVWDSIAATTTKDENTEGVGSHPMGKHARLMSQGFRKFNHLISDLDVAVIFLNQTRQKIGVMYGDDEATFGGNATKFYSSARVRLKRGKKIKQGKKIIGVQTTAIVVKNKVAIPFKEALLPIYFGYGIDDAEASFEYLKAADIITSPSNGWYELEGIVEKKFQRKDWQELYDEHYDDIVNLFGVD